MAREEVPTDHLSSLDSWGRHLKIYPAAVHGFFAKYRRIVHAFLILLFLVLPWLKIDGKQALLLNFSSRQFSIFGYTFWAHDGPLVFFILGITTLSLAFFTAIFGRVWCGWACPQTVFIDSVYRKIEQWIEGNHIQRRKLDNGPLTFDKFRKKLLKWAIYLVITLFITHSFLAYFVGADDLLKMIQSSPYENWASFLFIFVSTALILIDFAIFREQFCLIVCPYGRFQSVLVDQHSYSVSYDYNRGEPRKGHNKEKQGDCVDCFKCVNVCPTGIDIRNGLQMECIQCTACIDACDEVMVKIKKPKGLIRYSTEAALKSEPHKTLRPRIFAYLGIILLLVIGLGVTLHNRKPINFTILRGKDVPYQEVGNDTKTIINHLKLHLKNQTLDTKKVKVSIQNQPEVQLILPQNPVSLQPGQLIEEHFFLKFNKDFFLSNSNKQITLIFQLGTHSYDYNLELVGPNR